MQRSNSEAVYQHSGLSAKRSVLKTRLQNNKEQIYCEWRHRWVRLTPEEWVRQQLLHRLTELYGYPAGLMAVEVQISVGDARRRCDAVVYDRAMQPLMLIECKAETVALTQRTLDQAATYNRRLCVPYLMLHNGPATIVARVAEDKIEYLETIPEWNNISH
ncbi:MAG: type I restriction enzyme HsdR N-terminal domain-containing protein [Paludibacteraceae bacterium]|nr:type I restriction enzyme HsdR N-terminal domain-containing protein [Paludibacteraceae bacterium]